MFTRVLILFVFFQVAVGNTGCAQVQLSRAMTLMGSRFEITVVGKDSTAANKHIDRAVAEIERIENLISEWRPHTQIAEVNRYAGIRPVKVDREVFELTRRSVFFSEQSDGAFDISITAMDRIWRFDGSMDSIPTAEEIRRSVENVGYGNIELDTIQQTVFLKKKGMKIGFGSIGKGYAADRGRTVLMEEGVSAGLVNASGDIASWGKQLDGKPWRVGVYNPFRPGKMAKVLKMANAAVATSGSYEKYVEFGGVRYSHIINPKTGYPSTELTSVTVYGPSAEFANGLSTTIMVLGKAQGRMLLKRFPDYKAILITAEQQVILF